ncbi:MAG TPA: Urease accessory protein UreE, partial [Rhodospirillales bacterium]|nr:Urease accessory protein UreE [Rhodospirillales bacterium]
MVQGLGAATHRLTAPFEPEGGAYEHSHTHSSGEKT